MAYGVVYVRLRSLLVCARRALALRARARRIRLVCAAEWLRLRLCVVLRVRPSEVCYNRVFDRLLRYCAPVYRHR